MNYYVEKENCQIREYGIEYFINTEENPRQIAFSHTHTAVEFIYVKSGSYIIDVDNESFEVGSGDLMIFRANAIHTIRLVSETPPIYYVLKVSPTLLFQIFVGEKQVENVLPFIQKSPKDISHIKKDDLPIEIVRVWEKIVAELEGDRCDKMTARRIYAGEMLLEATRTLPSVATFEPLSEDISERTVAMIYDSVVFINENYAADITAGDCAEHIHISYSYFARLFRAVMGKTFKEYLVSVRLSKARKLLFTSDLSISDIAYSCGFNSLSYFISQYRTMYGKTPRSERSEIN